MTGPVEVDHDGMAVFDTMWAANPMFRRTMYLVTIVWAVAFLVQGVVTAAIIYYAPFETAYNYDQILPLVATGIGIAASIALGNRSRKEGEARRAAAQQGAAPA